MVYAPEMLGASYRSTNALMPLAADAARLLTARFLACIAGNGREVHFLRKCHMFRLSSVWVVPTTDDPEIQEVNSDGPSRPIILAEAIKRKCHVPFQTRSRARDIKRTLAHMNVFGSNAPNEPDLARISFVRGIPQSGVSGLKTIA